MELYAPWYMVVKGLFGPARVREAAITIFNRPDHRPDPELEREAKEHLLRSIVAKEGAGVVQASGGIEALRGIIGIEMLWLDRKKR